MRRIVHSIVNSARTRRVEVYEAADGTFGFTHWKWGALEQEWTETGPAGSRCDTAETALRELKSRVDWVGRLGEDSPSNRQDYACAEYFSDGWSLHGHFDEASQNFVIVPLDDTYEDEECEFFVIGRSGGDGIDFGYRKGASGLWAYYPIEHRFKFMAPSILALVEGWCSGKLFV
jgi:hypothetical protein